MTVTGTGQRSVVLRIIGPAEAGDRGRPSGVRLRRPPGDRTVVRSRTAPREKGSSVRPPARLTPTDLALLVALRRVGVAGRSHEVRLTIQVRRREPAAAIATAPEPAAIASAPAASPPGVPVPGWDSLTDIEQRIARLVSHAKTNREIARAVFLSPHTVNYHLRRIFQKLGIRSRTRLAAMVPPA